MAYLAVRTQMKSYLFELDGPTNGLKKALGARAGSLSVFDTKSSALQWLESTGLPVEIAPKIKAPTLVAGMCCLTEAKKKVIRKQG